MVLTRTCVARGRNETRLTYPQGATVTQESLARSPSEAMMPGQSACPAVPPPAPPTDQHQHSLHLRLSPRLSFHPRKPQSPHHLPRFHAVTLSPRLMRHQLGDMLTYNNSFSTDRTLEGRVAEDDEKRAKMCLTKCKEPCEPRETPCSKCECRQIHVRVATYHQSSFCASCLSSNWNQPNPSLLLLLPPGLLHKILLWKWAMNKGV